MGKSYRQGKNRGKNNKKPSYKKAPGLGKKYSINPDPGYVEVEECH